MKRTQPRIIRSWTLEKPRQTPRPPITGPAMLAIILCALLIAARRKRGPVAQEDAV